MKTWMLLMALVLVPCWTNADEGGRAEPTWMEEVRGATPMPKICKLMQDSDIEGVEPHVAKKVAEGLLTEILRADKIVDRICDMSGGEQIDFADGEIVIAEIGEWLTLANLQPSDIGVSTAELRELLKTNIARNIARYRELHAKSECTNADCSTFYTGMAQGALDRLHFTKEDVGLTQDDVVIFELTTTTTTTAMTASSTTSTTLVSSN